MKINSVNIISFGGLKNYSLNFTKGLNCIYGENEQGKSTVMAFIKMMFYGNERGSSQLSKNIRKKYTPWDASPMLGSLEFELNGKAYRLEREFKSSNSTDRVTLTDLQLGEKQSVEGDIGKELFGLSAAAFERSIFIGQLGFPESNTQAEGEINARLSNLASTGDESISLNDVTNKLSRARLDIISKSGRAGEYLKTEQLACDKGNRYKVSVAVQKKYLEDKESLLAFAKETEDLEKKLSSLKSIIAKEQDIKNSDNLRELLKTKAELEKLKAKLKLSDGTIADESYLRSVDFTAGKYNEAVRTLNAKKSEREIISKNLDNLLNAPTLSVDEAPVDIAEDLKKLDLKLTEGNTKIGEITNKLSLANQRRTDLLSRKKPFNPLLFILNIIFLVCCIISYFKSGIVLSAVMGAACLLSIVLSFVLKPNNAKKLSLIEEEISALNGLLSTANEGKEDLINQINSKKARLSALELSAKTNSNVIESAKAQLRACDNELDVLESQKNTVAEELLIILKKMGVENSENHQDATQELRKNFQAQKELKLKINTLLGVLNNISYEDAERKLSELSDNTIELPENFDRIKSEYEELSETAARRKTQEYSMALDLKNLISSADSPDVLERELKELNALLARQKLFCDSADIALEVLAESFAELRESYGSQLEKNAGEIFCKLTEGKYTQMTVSKSFGLNVNPANSLSREADYLSSGAYDLAYLSLRLSVASLISENEALPLFLDDTLTQFDDTRVKTTLSFLKDYCENGQAIMFTCHNSILKSAEELGCRTDKL